MADFYISPSGNDGDVGSIGSPRLTLPGGIALLASGDTLNTRAGTYSGTGVFEAMFNKGGSSWSNLTTIRGYQSEVAIVANGIGLGVPPSGSSISYFLFKSMIFDGGNSSGIGIGGGGYIGGNIDHIKLEDLEIKNAPGQGIELGGPVGDGGNCWVLRCRIHDCGFNTPGDHFNHGIYTESSGNIVEYCDIYDNNHGWGIHNYNNPSLGGTSKPSNNVYRFNKISRNGNETSTSGGMVCWTGNNNFVHNNLFIENYNYAADLREDVRFYNNTLYRNGLTGPFVQPGVIVAGSQCIVRNNLGVNNGNNFISGSPVQDHNEFRTV